MRTSDLIAALVLLFGIVLMAAGYQERRVKVYEDSNYRWVHIKHESGAQYLIRADSILGFYAPQPGNNARNEVMVAHKSLGTDMDMAEFADVVGVEIDE